MRRLSGVSGCISVSRAEETGGSIKHSSLGVWGQSKHARLLLLIVRRDLHRSPYVPSGLVRISDMVKNQRYGHFFFPNKKNLEFLITSQRKTRSLKKKVYMEVRPIIAQFLASFNFSISWICGSYYKNDRIADARYALNPQGRGGFSVTSVSPDARLWGEVLKHSRFLSGGTYRVRAARQPIGHVSELSAEILDSFFGFHTTSLNTLISLATYHRVHTRQNWDLQSHRSVAAAAYWSNDCKRLPLPAIPAPSNLHIVKIRLGGKSLKLLRLRSP
jgi:hypothetical protein